MPTTEMRSVLTGTAGLSVLLVVAIVLTLRRPRISADPTRRRRGALLLLAAVAGQALHFTEELRTEFYLRFPAVLGLPAWSREFFVGFNLAWIALWLVAALGLARRIVVALGPAWFLALALVANGIAHPLLALRSGAYFPGLYSSPLVLVLGLVLAGRLARLTGNGDAAIRETS